VDLENETDQQAERIKREENDLAVIQVLGAMKMDHSSNHNSSNSSNNTQRDQRKWDHRIISK